MTEQRQSTGRRGEDLAAAFLRTKGFHVIVRNWRCRFGEIDMIVAREEDVRFMEVKTRRSKTYGHPSESVTPTKLLHLRRCIECWLLTRPSHPKKYQADVIAITALPHTEPVIEWIEGVL